MRYLQLTLPRSTPSGRLTDGKKQHDDPPLPVWKQARYTFPTMAILLVNLVEYLSSVGASVSRFLQSFGMIPKILVVMMLYVIAIYYDCQRLGKNLAFIPFFETSWFGIPVCFSGLSIFGCFNFLWLYVCHQLV